ncbi:MAG TPA: hypothetical protein VLJ80_06115 [Solirubrobacteraceae bacterium]|nr:hypothetical protein [Solirubrobacteraceae bacterium]
MATLVLWLVVALVVGTSAKAATQHILLGSFGTEGSGPGQLLSPAGVAVNGSTSLSDPGAGNVYVVDKGNLRIELFDATGSTFLGEFEPPGGFSAPEGIAVDGSEDPLDLSAGDVYVVDAGRSVIDKFDAEGVFIGELTEAEPGVPFAELEGIAVDGNGQVFVYQASSEIDIFDDAVANKYVGPTPPPESGFTPIPGSGFAVDAEEDLYVIRGNRDIAKVNAQGVTLSSDVTVTPQEPGGERTAASITVDLANGDLYADTEGGVRVYRVTEASSERLELFGSEVLPEGLPEGSGIAVNASNGRAYVSNPAGDTVDIFDEVTLPSVSTGEAGNLQHEGDATLTGAVDPEGIEVTACEFEYGPDESYGQTAPCDTAPGAGEAPVSVSADITGLTPGATYHFRLVASNASGTTHGTDSVFTAFARPRVDGESANEVTADAATLAAQINPGATDSTYHFEVGRTIAYEKSLPAVGGHTGASASDVAVSVRVQGLQPETVYHFRLVASNVLDGTGEQSSGEDRMFTTRSLAAPASSPLPDGRGWELVSPPEKLGATVEAITAEGGAIQAAEDGSSLAYVANAPIEDRPEGNPAKELTQVLARRGSGGWLSRDIATPHDTATGVQAGNPSEYKLFSADLSLSLVEQVGEDATPLSPSASEKTPYERDGAGGYTPLVSAANAPPGTQFGGLVSFTAATPDLSHVVLSSEAQLTNTPIASLLDLYEWFDGRFEVVSLLPNGEPAPVPALGLNSHDVRHAVSDDGSHVVFSSEAHLYLRDLNIQKTFEVDANQGGTANGLAGHPQFQTASSDDSRVFFTDPERLTEDSTAESPTPTGGDLYVYEEKGQKLTDLTVDHNVSESAEVQGAVPGASEDGSIVYFVARGVLSNTPNAEGALPVAGSENLYLVERSGAGWGAPRFIATLSNDDRPDWGGEEEASADLGRLTARVSPNGRFLAFMSDRPLTGYDNTDTHSGTPDEEVFLLDAQQGTLSCASCNPTGGRPSGVFDSGVFPGLLVDRGSVWEGRWLAGSIPGWTLVDDFHALYQSRYLSNEGRLFFDSPDSLAPQDINGVEDVYEYEPDGQGSCGQEHGCISLLSSGESTEESAFLDASVSGGDAFFLTAAQLSGQDRDGSEDVYDAHVCTAVLPCPPATASAPEPCASAESCRPAPALQPSFGAPPTLTLSGAGNLPPSAPAAKPKPLTRAQKLAKALSACHKDKRKKKRRACEAQARKRFGPVKKKPVSHRAAAHKARGAGA